MEPYLLKGGTVVTPSRTFKGSVLLKDGKIEWVGTEEKTWDAIEIDVGGAYVLPGFIDVHVHGGGGACTMDGTYDAINTISIAHAQGGTTAMIPTTYSSSPRSMFAAVQAVSEAMKKGVKGATILGAHLEGP